MIAAKRGEWAQACADYPDLSPFTLLKLSMVRYGAELSRGALERLQDPRYSFGQTEPFGIRFEGRAPALALPGRGLLRAWVRYRGGSVGLSVASGGSVWPLALTGTRSTVNAQGEACSEAAFRGAGSFPESGNLAFRLDLDPEGDAVTVFDYGVILA